MDGQNNLTIPIAIVAAGILIAGGIYFAGNKSDSKDDKKNTPKETVTLRPVDENDHIVGNPNADIIIVEYSDIECPYCKNFHNTMNRIMDEYAKDGKVAWVYRHFPIDSSHPKARKEAEATECANELGGNTAFWDYINKIFEITPSNNKMDMTLLPQIAEDIGLDKAAFEECLAGERHADRVEADYQDGLKAGVRGTPLSVVITKKDGKTYPISGAQPYNTVKTIIDAAIADL